MAKATENKRANRPKTHSSVSVSRKIVCEDEACIGKVADTHKAPSEEEVRQDKTDKESQRPGTSMSVAGKDACADESCIGKT